MRTAGRRSLKARYDAAQTTLENEKHWAMADSMSADALGTYDRKTLRTRSRYEVANNSYAKGIALTLANDCVGTGPRLQMLLADGEANRKVEDAFTNWCIAVNLTEKLRTMRQAKLVDGEAFAVLVNNPYIDSPVQLDVKLVEADRVDEPWNWRNVILSPTNVEGIAFDEYGNPTEYCIYRQHPGDITLAQIGYDWWDAGSVIHWFRADRPDQHRGFSEIAPALPLFAQLRRFTLAVIAAAETAADFAAVLYTDAPANGDAAEVDALDVVELERRMATTLPEGWKLGQVQAQQPTTTYAEFKKEILNEIARCLNLPYNVAAGNSAGYNYASGRLDHQTYFKSIRVEQSHLCRTVLDPIFAAWFDEAKLLPEFAELRNENRVPHQWFFDGNEHVDPAKEASAQAQRLANHTTTLAAEYARQGKDWETELRQRAKEQKLMRDLGLTDAQASPAGMQDRQGTGNDDDSEDA